MKKKYTFVTLDGMERPTYQYESGKGEGCYRDAYYFELFDSVEELERELQDKDFNYFDDNEDELVIVTVYTKE